MTSLSEQINECTFRADGFSARTYKRMLTYMLRYGEPVESRLGPTHELQGFTCVMPSGVMFVRPGMSRSLGWAEAFSVAAGTILMPDVLELVAPNLRYQYDPSSQYGPRVGSQLESTISMLVDDPNTRRAIIHIGGPFETEARACVDSYTFELRNNLLNMHVFVRSWDMIAGFIYDTMVTNFMLQYVAWLINVIPGYVYSYAASAHIYDVDLERLPTTNGYGEIFKYEPDEDVEAATWRERYTLSQIQLLQAAVAPRWWLSNERRIPKFIYYIPALLEESLDDSKE